MLTDWFTSNKTAPWLPAVPAGTAWREVLWISRTSEVSLVSNHNHLLLRKMRLVQEEGWGELGGGGQSCLIRQPPALQTVVRQLPAVTSQ